MKETERKKHIVMGISPRTDGVAFAVFHGPWRPMRWGVKGVRKDKNAQSVRKIAELMDTYRPAVIILEDYAGEGSRRAERIENLIDAIADLAARQKITVRRYSRGDIRESFDGFHAHTKYEIAQAIATTLPEMRPALPPKRKIWLPEDPRMGIFDAAALVFSFFYFSTQRKRAA